MVPIGIKNTPPPRPLNAAYTLRAQKDIFANVFVYDRNLERDKLFYIKDIIEYFDNSKTLTLMRGGVESNHLF